MRRPPVHCDTPPQTTFAGNDETQVCWLSHHGSSCRQPLAESQNTPIGVFFVYSRCKPDIARRLHSFFFDSENSMHHGGQTTLGVTSSPAIYGAVADHWIERVDGHVVNSRRIDVRFEHQDAL